MICVCRITEQFAGLEARQYVSEHLLFLRMQSHLTRKSLFICPYTGIRWIREYRCSVNHLLPQIQLRRDPDSDIRRVKCRCNSTELIVDPDADEYVLGHLTYVRTLQPGSWEDEFVCLETGAKWLADHPHSELHGGGPQRLRKLPASSQNE